MDTAAVKAALQELSTSGVNTGKDLEKGAKAGQDGFNNVATSLLGVQSGLGLVQQLSAALGASMRDATEHVAKLIDKYAALRESIRGIAALEHKLPTNEFTSDFLAQTETGAGKVLTADEYVSGKEAFQQFGSGYVGPGKKTTQEAMNELLPDVMAYAKMRKMSPATAMKGLTTIIQNMPAGTSVAKYKEVFAKVMEASEFSRGSAELSMSQFITVAAENVGEGMPFGEGQEGLEKSIAALGVEQEAHAGDAGTFLKDMMQGIEHVRKSGKAGDLGIEEGDDPKTIAEKIKVKWDQYKADNPGHDTFQEFWRQYGGGHGGLNAAKAIQTLIDKGLKGGGFKNTEEAMEKQSAETFDAYLQAATESDLGQSYQQAHRLEAAEMANAQKYLPTRGLRNKAREELESEGYFQSYGFAQLYRQTIGRVASGGESPEEQAIGTRAVEDQLDKIFGKGMSLGRTNFATDTVGMSVNDQLLMLMKMQHKESQEQTDLQRQVAKKPLSAPPPKPAERH